MYPIENQKYDEERALYGSTDLILNGCMFDGDADGESAMKECKNIIADHCFFNLRYPFWHNDNLKIKGCEMTELCRAALWYSDHIEITDTRLHGIKALRECNNIKINKCSIKSTEFGWFSKNIEMNNCTAESEYFMLRAENIKLNDVQFNGKYSFQYISNSVFDNCVFNTKDAFWHAKNVVVKNSVVNGEYLAWYSENITFENCIIKGTQPLCYCKALRLINCRMIDTDLCFEKSEVDATITTHVISIKNVSKGRIEVPSVDEIICDDENAEGEIIILQNKAAV